MLLESTIHIYKHLLINPPTHVVWCVYMIFDVSISCLHSTRLVFITFRRGFYCHSLSHSLLFFTIIIVVIANVRIGYRNGNWIMNEIYVRIYLNAMYVLCTVFATYANNQQKAVRAIKVIFANWNGVKKIEKVKFSSKFSFFKLILIF